MRFLRDQGLAITMFGIFAVTLVGLALTGWNNYNGEQIEHSMAPVNLGQYLTTPSFGESVFENWESEFLQMGAYVLLTAFLFSRGSSESKDPDSSAPQDADPRGASSRKRVPRPVRAGGITLALYEHSLTLALFGIFAASFVLHAVTGGSLAGAVPRHRPVLVRVVPELAERIPRRGRPDRAIDRSTRARLARVQARGRESRRYRVLMGM